MNPHKTEQDRNKLKKSLENNRTHCKARQTSRKLKNTTYKLEKPENPTDFALYLWMSNQFVTLSIALPMAKDVFSYDY